MELFPHTCIYFYTVHVLYIIIIIIQKIAAGALLAFHGQNPEVHLQLFPHTCTYFHTVHVLYIIIQKIASALLQLLSNFEDFNNAVCHVMKITTAESSPGVGFFNTTNVPALAPAI